VYLHPPGNLPCPDPYPIFWGRWTGGCHPVWKKRMVIPLLIPVVEKMSDNRISAK